MSDVMTDLKVALTEVANAKREVDHTAVAATNAQTKYQESLAKVRALREQVNREIDDELAKSGINTQDSRVSQSS